MSKASSSSTSLFQQFAATCNEFNAYLRMASLTLGLQKET